MIVYVAVGCDIVWGGGGGWDVIVYVWGWDVIVYVWGVGRDSVCGCGM